MTVLDFLPLPLPSCWALGIGNFCTQLRAALCTVHYTTLHYTTFTSPHWQWQWQWSQLAGCNWACFWSPEGHLVKETVPITIVVRPFDEILFVLLCDPINPSLIQESRLCLGILSKRKRKKKAEFRPSSQLHRGHMKNRIANATKGSDSRPETIKIEHSIRHNKKWIRSKGTIYA